MLFYQLRRNVESLTEAPDTNVGASSTTRQLVQLPPNGHIAQIQRAEQLSSYDAFGHRIDNLSVTEIRHHEGSLVTGRINHLP